MDTTDDHRFRQIAIRIALTAAALSVLLGCSVLSTSRSTPTTVDTVIPTRTPTPGPTESPIQVATPTPSGTATSTPTELRSPTPTATPSPAPTSTPLPPADTPTPSPPSPTTTPDPASECDVLPEGAFLQVWQADPARQAALGCPASYRPRVTPQAWEVDTSYQPFEQGAMVWSSQSGWFQQPIIYVLHPDGTYATNQDTYTSGDATAGLVPPSGLHRPILGFGKVWQENPEVKDALGWATAPESPGPGRYQGFERGEMIWLSQLFETYVFIDGPPTYSVVTTTTFALPALRLTSLRFTTSRSPHSVPSSHTPASATLLDPLCRHFVVTPMISFYVSPDRHASTCSVTAPATRHSCPLIRNATTSTFTSPNDLAHTGCLRSR